MKSITSPFQNMFDFQHVLTPIAVVIKAFELKMRVEISGIFSDFAKEVQRKILGNYAPGSWERATIEQLEERSALQQKVLNAAPWAAKSGINAEEFLVQMLES